MKTIRLFFWRRCALAALLCAPVAGRAQSILLSSGDFAVLGGTGITNTGATNILSRNVGSTATTGFNPTGTVTNGGVIVSDPAVLTQAQTDLIHVATKLALMPSDQNLSNQGLGGKTLIPGVYTFDDAADQALGTTLTLDAQGQNNAVWVFQIHTTLTTGANSNMTLINPGTNLGMDDGIYWSAGTGITVGATNLIIGNFLAGTTITFGVGTNGSGRALAQTQVTLSNNVFDSAPGGSPSGWDSGLMYNSFGDIVPIPEPAAVLLLAPLAAIGLGLWKRGRRQTVALKTPV